MLVLPDAIPAELKKDGAQKRIMMVRGNVYLANGHALGVEMFERVTGWLEKGLIKVRGGAATCCLRWCSDSKSSQLRSKLCRTDSRA